MKKILLLTAILSCSISVFAQKATGLIFDDESYDKIPHLPVFNGSKYDELPVKHSLRDYSPYPGNQGEEQSCMAWSSGYGALTIMEAIQNGNTDRDQITANAFSTSYIYNAIKKDDPRFDCGKGCSFGDLFDFLESSGDCRKANFEGESPSCVLNAEGHHDAEAGGAKIREFANVFARKDAPRVKVDKVKKLIANDIPVIIGFKMFQSLVDVPHGQKVWKSRREKDQFLGGHAMLVIGYDDYLKAFEVMNSWGTEWADDGYVYIKYGDFAANCKYASNIVPSFEAAFNDYSDPYGEDYVDEYAEDTYDDQSNDTYPPVEDEYSNDEYSDNSYQDQAPPPPPLPDGGSGPAIKGSFDFLKATNGAAQISFDGSARQYWLNNLQMGDRFQIMAKDVSAGVHVYVFSVDENSQAFLHWPKWNSESFGYGEVPMATYVPTETAEIMLPSSETGFEAQAGGKNDLVIFYAYEEIYDFEERLYQQQWHPDNLEETLQLAFGDIMVPADQVEYDPYTMSMNCTLSNPFENYAVPLILRAVVR